MQIFPTIYKRDSKGKVREWRMEVEEDRYRTVAGLEDGLQVTSEWTIADPKNVGRKNATTGAEQAIAEVNSKYKKKLDIDYHESVENIDTPKMFIPMSAHKWDDRKGKIDYDTPVWTQPKLDGIRCIATRFGLWTRKGKPIVAVPHILEALSPAFEINPNAVFDGELYNHDFRDDFNEITSIVKRIKVTKEDLEKSKRLMQLHLYDFPTNMDEKFSDRFSGLIDILTKSGVVTLLEKDNSPIRIVDTMKCTSESEIDDRYNEYVELGFEGGIIRIDAPYNQKRSNNLLKRKDFEDAEFVIVRIEEGKGNWSGHAKRLIFQNDQGECGETGAGIKGKMPYLKKVFEERDLYIGEEATVRFFGRTPGKLKPRIPVAQVLHKTGRW